MVGMSWTWRLVYLIVLALVVISAHYLRHYSPQTLKLITFSLCAFVALGLLGLSIYLWKSPELRVPTLVLLALAAYLTYQLYSIWYQGELGAWAGAVVK
jgi:hypothetical protein